MSFIEALENGDIESISFQPVAGVLTVEGVMKGYEEGEKFTTNILANDTSIMEELRQLKLSGKRTTQNSTSKKHLKQVLGLPSLQG